MKPRDPIFDPAVGDKLYKTSGSLTVITEIEHREGFYVTVGVSYSTGKKLEPQRLAIDTWNRRAMLADRIEAPQNTHS